MVQPNYVNDFTKRVNLGIFWLVFVRSESSISTASYGSVNMENVLFQYYFTY